ncbi:hypothetical protein [Rhodanobacter sp. MP7CTX1]|uniref:hypothetical protein n=1 Tax=Rhodanobacter sp. MP7CTX1 TaxID=2723084 RepID=UPI0016096F1F|nr:hypothetical protein [Rhodanobacter sp. MP7CTX1]MBB6186654.1 hypothetical protein [Rhodanobacter sp. MP7CTX1]
MPYTEDFRSAEERSRRLGLAVPAYAFESERRWLDATAHAQFPYIVRGGLGELDFSDVVGQCLAIHYRLLPVIQEWLGCPVLYTNGWVDDGTENGMFRFDEMFIEDRLRTYRTGGLVNIHAWLTLPSMEIIDVSLATSMAVLQGLPSGHGGVIAMHGDQTRGFSYKPMLVGLDFLHKTGMAGSRDDGRAACSYVLAGRK